MVLRITGAGIENLLADNISASGSVSLPSTTSIGDVSDTEIEYLNGVTSNLQTQINEKSPILFVENVRTSNYTLVISDTAKVIAFNSTSNLTLTVPNNTSVAFPIGTVINVYRANTGAVTISGAAGVTIRNAGTIPSQFGERSLRKRATNEWVLT